MIGAGYLGFVLLLTWQALRGQSIVAPDPATLAAAAGLLAGAASVAVVITADARRTAGSLLPGTVSTASVEFGNSWIA